MFYSSYMIMSTMGTAQLLNSDINIQERTEVFVMPNALVVCWWFFDYEVNSTIRT